MEYSEQIAAAMLADPRYVGAITEKMVRVWKSRGTIPKQYFNPKYCKAIKDGRPDLANQVKDPYYNESFTLKAPLTDAEKRLQDRLIAVLSSGKIVEKEILKAAGVAYNYWMDAKRTGTKQVDLRAEHLLLIKKVLQEYRIKVKSIVERMSDKTRFSELEVKKIDEVFASAYVSITATVDNPLYSGRVINRIAGKQTYYEHAEISHLLNQLSIFLLETST